MAAAIWSPHPDDEIIGTYHALLQARETGLAVHYASPLEEGCQRAALGFGFAIHRLDLTALDCWDVVYAPDPDYDRHPLHQTIGNHARALFRSGHIRRLIQYTTRMTAPYIWEVPHPLEKLDALNGCYPEKADLWKYDHRFWLFEGACEWRRLR
jgi:hypothetical protein